MEILRTVALFRLSIRIPGLNRQTKTERQIDRERERENERKEERGREGGTERKRERVRGREGGRKGGTGGKLGREIVGTILLNAGSRAVEIRAGERTLAGRV